MPSAGIYDIINYRLSAQRYCRESEDYGSYAVIKGKERERIMASKSEKRYRKVKR